MTKAASSSVIFANLLKDQNLKGVIYKKKGNNYLEHKRKQSRNNSWTAHRSIQTQLCLDPSARNAYKTTVQVLVHRENVFTIPLYLQAISNTISQLYYTKKFYCLDLWGFFWTRGQCDNLDHKFPVYIYLFIQPYAGKNSSIYASYRKLQKSGKCNKKGKSGEKSDKIPFTTGAGMGIKMRKE